FRAGGLTSPARPYGMMTAGGRHERAVARRATNNGPGPGAVGAGRDALRRPAPALAAGGAHPRRSLPRPVRTAPKRRRRLLPPRRPRTGPAARVGRVADPRRVPPALPEFRGPTPTPLRRLRLRAVGDGFDD